MLWKRTILSQPSTDPPGQPCPAEDSPHRVRALPCNTHACPVQEDEQDQEQRPTPVPGSPQVLPSQSVKVDFLWGVEGFRGRAPSAGEDPLSGLASPTVAQQRSQPILDPKFDLSDPRAQEAALEACLRLQASGELFRREYRLRCPMRAFRDWLQRSGPRQHGSDEPIFPLEAPGLFDSWFQTWIRTEGAGFGSMVGFRPDGGVAWISASAVTWVGADLPANLLLPHYTRIQGLMAGLNQDSPSTFQGFQTSQRWSLMRVELAFIDGLILGIATSSVLIFLSILAFTQELWLSVLVQTVILGVLGCVLGCIGLWGWPLGVVECLVIPICLGLCIDYSLHIAHAYSSADHFRAQQKGSMETSKDFPGGVETESSSSSSMSVSQSIPPSSSSSREDILTSLPVIAPSVCLAALTSVGAMVFLLFAKIHLISKVGQIIAVTLTFGLMYSLFALPPLLLFVGRKDPFRWGYRNMKRLYHHRTPTRRSSEVEEGSVKKKDRKG